MDMVMIFSVYEREGVFNLLPLFFGTVFSFTTHLLAFVALAFTGEAIPFFVLCSLSLFGKKRRNQVHLHHYIYGCMAQDFFIVGGFSFPEGMAMASRQISFFCRHHIISS